MSTEKRRPVLTPNLDGWNGRYQRLMSKVSSRPNPYA